MEFTTEQLLRLALAELESIPKEFGPPLFINDKPLNLVIREHLEKQDIFFDAEGRN